MGKKSVIHRVISHVYKITTSIHRFWFQDEKKKNHSEIFQNNSICDEKKTY